MESVSRNRGDQYDQLLAQARESQAAVDRAIEELRQIQRFLSDGPAIIAARRQAADQARLALEEAENRVVNAEETMSAKQIEVAKLMESAAACQQALARCLAPGQTLPDLNPPVQPVNESAPSNARSGATVADLMASSPSAASSITQESADGSGWQETYTFPTGQVRQTPDDPAASDSEVVRFLADRDVLCPSCGTPLRGVQQPRCRNCRMQLSLAVLKSTGPRGSTKLMWAIRIIACLAVLMSLYLAFSNLTHRPLIGCGAGSACERVYSSGYARIFNIPVALLGAGFYSLIAFTTLFTGIGRRDGTRRRAWAALSVLAMMAGGAAVWFLFVQFAVLKGICPHCMLVDLAGLTIAGLVLFNAPLLRPEKLPDDAVGPITLHKRAAFSLGGAALVCLLLFAIVHHTTKGPASYVQQPYVQPNKPQDDKGGLMMSGLKLAPNRSKDEQGKGAATDNKKDAAGKKDADNGKVIGGKNGLMFQPVQTKGDGKTDGGDKGGKEDTGGKEAKERTDAKNVKDGKQGDDAAKTKDEKEAVNTKEKSTIGGAKGVLFQPLTPNPKKDEQDEMDKQEAKDENDAKPDASK